MNTNLLLQSSNKDPFWSSSWVDKPCPSVVTVHNLERNAKLTTLFKDSLTIKDAFANYTLSKSSPLHKLQLIHTENYPDAPPCSECAILISATIRLSLPYESFPNEDQPITAYMVATLNFYHFCGTKKSDQVLSYDFSNEFTNDHEQIVMWAKDHHYSINAPSCSTGFAIELIAGAYNMTNIEFVDLSVLYSFTSSYVFPSYLNDNTRIAQESIEKANTYYQLQYHEQTLEKISLSSTPEWPDLEEASTASNETYNVLLLHRMPRHTTPPIQSITIAATFHVEKSSCWALIQLDSWNFECTLVAEITSLEYNQNNLDFTLYYTYTLPSSLINHPEDMIDFLAMINNNCLTTTITNVHLYLHYTPLLSSPPALVLAPDSRTAPSQSFQPTTKEETNEENSSTAKTDIATVTKEETSESGSKETSHKRSSSVGPILSKQQGVLPKIGDTEEEEEGERQPGAGTTPKGKEENKKPGETPKLTGTDPSGDGTTGERQLGDGTTPKGKEEDTSRIPDPTQNDTKKKDQDSRNRTKLIISVVVGLICGLVLLAIFVYLIHMYALKRRSTRYRSSHPAVQIPSYDNNALEGEYEELKATYFFPFVKFFS